MFTHRKKYTPFFLVVLIIISAFFRFYNLNWGAPYYFHPDERNIASSVSQLKFPVQMNPHFFAYGSLPIYTIYFTGFFLNLFLQLLSPKPYPLNPGFDQAIIISRFFSAFFSLALIPLLFFIGKKLKDERTGLIAASLAVVSAGFIQFAHFGTFEMWLTLLSALLFLSIFDLLRRPGPLPLFLTSVVFSLSVATKVSHLALLPIPIIFIFINQIHKNKFKPNNPDIKSFLFGSFKFISNLIKDILLFLIITTIIFFITNPFVLLDYSSFYSSMKYESEVALGTLPVFYTGEFVNAFPIIFQFLHIYPFLINPLLTVLFIPSFFCILFIAIKYKHIPFLLLIFCFLLLFLPQAFLYAKWTRYMMPTLPFMYLVIALAFSDFLKLKIFYSSSERSESRSLKALVLDFARTIKINHLVLSIIFGINILFGASYFITAFIQKDTRFAAKNYALQSVPPNASILSEVYDLGITPFNGSYPNITLYDFYDLDNNSPQYIPQADYIILPSQRILKVRLQESKAYPAGHIFYSDLLIQTNRFKKIYETPCDFFCAVTYLNNPVFGFEETANVFDRPTVFIFKKIDNL